LREAGWLSWALWLTPVSLVEATWRSSEQIPDAGNNEMPWFPNPALRKLRQDGEFVNYIVRPCLKKKKKKGVGCKLRVWLK
jgi:hypothetical protein